MDTFSVDLHIHSPHSIAVSKSLNLDTMVNTAQKKGLQVIGTGDITQPAWRRYMENNLEREGAAFVYNDVYFVIQTELEDNESIHHVVLLPDFASATELTDALRDKCKDIDGNWAGRPHVHLSPAELVELVISVGGLIGPAHAFTPFKSIFRHDRYSTLEECFEGAERNVAFLELGLSADTNIADQLSCLSNVSFLSNSDAHSQGPQSLGREFNRVEMESASFEELADAFGRRNGRGIRLNVGLDPRLGKYYLMFCKKCRRRVIAKIRANSEAMQNSAQNLPFAQHSVTDTFVTYNFPDAVARRTFLQAVGRNRIACPACASSTKGSKIGLGVSDRLELIADQPPGTHPPHRPDYLDIIPLVELIRAIKGVKSPKAVSVTKAYDLLIKNLGPEFAILVDLPIGVIQKENQQIGDIIEAFREGTIQFIPGGGGTFGNITLPEFG